MKLSKKTNIAQDPVFGVIVGMAVRYAMGRTTTAPLDAIEFCKRHWDQINEPSRMMTERDVVNEIRRADHVVALGHRDPLGDECDRRDWCEFAAWMANQRGDKQETVSGSMPPRIAPYNCSGACGLNESGRETKRLSLQTGGEKADLRPAKDANHQVSSGLAKQVKVAVMEKQATISLLKR